MKLSIQQSDLETKLNEANRFTSSKNSSPLLSGFYLETKANSLIIRTSTGMVTYQTTLPCQVETEGSVVVPSGLTLSTIKALDTGEVTLELKEDILKINQKRSKSSIATMPADDFPALDLENKKQTIVLPVEEFTKYGQQVMVAASSDETKPVLTSLVIEMEQPNALVSTDGFRLFRAQVDLSLDEEGKFLLPARVLKDFFAILDKTDLKTIECLTSKAHQEIVFDLGETKLQVSAIQGEFPNYRAIIPQSTGFSYQVERETFLQKVNQAMIFAKEFSSIVIFEVVESENDGHELVISSQESVKGSTEARLPCYKVDGEPVRFACNGRYVLDFANAMDSEELKVQGNEPLKPVIFSDAVTDQYLYLIMPFKLQEE